MSPFDLADYAARDELTLGRQYLETFKDDRPAFERDRDRIVHCSAFRRLEYKTQVFVNHEGDYYRTRLTHSIEVAQIARALSKRLGLNTDLAEALALAHDLGHTPFGHSGEYAVQEIMEDAGGFEHNHQSLRVVTMLEDRYPNFPGLNLCFETREGIVKHSTYYDTPTEDAASDYHPEWRPTLEAQLINDADAIAYLNHDIDDGLESGLLHWEDLEHIEIWQMMLAAVKTRYGDVERRYQKLMAISQMIGFFIDDLAEATRGRIEQLGIKTLDDVRNGPPLVGHSERVKVLQEEIRAYQFDHLYKHYQLERRRFNAQRVIRGLFDAYLSEPLMLPPRYRDKIEVEGDKKRVICDYIAGMTDRYALQEYARLYESPKSF